VLCAGTSEGYAQLFRLLGDPGDAVHVPTPGYPLFEHLAELEGLDARRYALLPPAQCDGERWRVDLAQTEASLDASSRALLVIHPHNPTGSTLDPEDLAALRSLAARRDLALISDEVFLDPAQPGAAASALAGSEAQGLHFALSGASKLLALPQLKVAWIAVGGPETLRRDALARLEFASDAYLSVSPLASACLAPLLAQRDALTEKLRARCSRHRALLASAFGGSEAIRALPAEAGWAAILRITRPRGSPALDEEELALALLEDAGVLVQPGFWFELEAPPSEPDAIHLVLSLLPDPADFERGIAQLRSGIERVLARR
jgi:aspartate/methionine/tyrosine aminotransferase